MARTLITLAFLGIVGLANAQDAQDRQINVTETPAMAAVVEKRVALVDKTVTLSAEQREKVTHVYKRGRPSSRPSTHATTWRRA